MFCKKKEDRGARRPLQWSRFSTRGGTLPSLGSSGKVCRALCLPCAALVVPPQPTMLPPCAVHPLPIPARAAENHAALSCHRAGSLPHPPTRGARGRLGRRGAAQPRAERRFCWLLVPCRRLRRTALQRPCGQCARRCCAAELCRRPQLSLDALLRPFARTLE